MFNKELLIWKLSILKMLLKYTYWPELIFLSKKKDYKLLGTNYRNFIKTCAIYVVICVQKSDYLFCLTCSLANVSTASIDN